jgi:hypothetical protein
MPRMSPASPRGLPLPIWSLQAKRTRYQRIYQLAENVLDLPLQPVCFCAVLLERPTGLTRSDQGSACFIGNPPEVSAKTGAAGKRTTAADPGHQRRLHSELMAKSSHLGNADGDVAYLLISIVVAVGDVNGRGPGRVVVCGRYDVGGVYDDR